MKVLCKDRIAKINGAIQTARGVSSVASDVDQMFSSKSYQELETLERQIRGKLDSDDDIDVDYWEHLLKTLLVWKAKAKLRDLSKEIVLERLQKLRREQQDEAQSARGRLSEIFDNEPLSPESTPTDQSQLLSKLDPDPLLKLRSEERGREIIDEADFLAQIGRETTATPMDVPLHPGAARWFKEHASDG